MWASESGGRNIHSFEKCYISPIALYNVFNVLIVLVLCLPWLACYHLPINIKNKVHLGLMGMSLVWIINQKIRQTSNFDLIIVLDEKVTVLQLILKGT